MTSAATTYMLHNDRNGTIICCRTITNDKTRAEQYLELETEGKLVAACHHIALKHLTWLRDDGKDGEQ